MRCDVTLVSDHVTCVQVLCREQLHYTSCYTDLLEETFSEIWYYRSMLTC